MQALSVSSEPIKQEFWGLWVIPGCQLVPTKSRTPARTAGPGEPGRRLSAVASKNLNSTWRNFSTPIAYVPHLTPPGAGSRRSADCPFPISSLISSPKGHRHGCPVHLYAFAIPHAVPRHRRFRSSTPVNGCWLPGRLELVSLWPDPGRSRLDFRGVDILWMPCSERLDDE